MDDYSWVDFTKKSFPPSSYRDYDENTGTSFLHDEVQKGLLSAETVQRVFADAVPPEITKIKRSVDSNVGLCNTEAFMEDQTCFFLTFLWRNQGSHISQSHAIR